MTEVVRPADGDPAELRPCPPRCTEGRHFAEDTVIHAGDGYHRYGAGAEVPASYPLPGTADGAPAVVRAALKSWTHPLGTEPGQALIELSLGTAAERTNVYAEISPAEAEAAGRALIGLAAAARREGTGAASCPAAGGR